MSLFDIDNIFFTVLDYNMSYLEFFGVLFGLLAVWLSAKANIWSWPVGIVNVILAFFLYYQIQLYPDMFLQVFFFVTNVLGWIRWANPKAGEEDKKNELRVSYMKWKQFLLICSIGIVGTIVLGSLASRLHEWFPKFFPLPSAFPYVDSFITVMSIVTTFFMIQKKIECWIIWIVVDIVATYLYYVKGIKFYSFEYLIFTLLAAYGLWSWIRENKSYTTQQS
ncbi:MAG TPA: nicotinamide riboside transporter PnuC [Ohtaekwangia sp.]